MTTTKNTKPLAEPGLAAALERCATEPIHRIGTVQSVGVLLAVDSKTFCICQASANLDTIFPVAASRAIGQPLVNFIGGTQLERLQHLVQQKDWPDARIWSVALPVAGQQVRYDAQIFRSDDMLVIEVEQQQPDAGDVFHDLFLPIRDVLWKLDSEQDLVPYAQKSVEQVRLLTGFDRVMMYRFDANWDGEVIAESKADAVDSYLGNHFPASDIPPQARALYTRNLVRVIADVNAAPVPILGASHAAPSLDLTYSWLRSMSPMHMEYLRNMGVCASLSISLVQNDQLWGLIACHHFSPRYVSLRARELDEFIARSVSLKLIHMDQRERDGLNQRIRELLHEMTERIRSTERLDAVLHGIQGKLLGLVQAQGAVVSIDGRHHTLGSVPSERELGRLVDALRQQPAMPVLHTDSSKALFAEIGHDHESGDDRHGGLLVAPVDHDMANFVMWFRPSILRTMRWAGNPQKIVLHDAAGLHVSPRKSFATWIETYHDKSLPWSPTEVDAAAALSLSLIEVLAQKALRSSEESYRLLADNSADMIARLDLSGCFRFATAACRELLGLERAEIVGIFLQDVLEGGAALVPELLAQLPVVGATVTKVVRGKRTDARSVWIEATLKYTQDSAGQGEILLNGRDVTQRYNHQLAIENVHRRNALILESAGEGLVSIDLGQRVLYANEVACSMLGQTQAALLGQNCCDFFCQEKCLRPEQACCQTCAFLATLHDGETRQGQREVRVHTPGAPPLLVDYVCTPLLDGGAIVGCVIVFHVAAPNHSDNAHSAAAQAMLLHAEEAVMVTNAQARIISVNRAFTQITGFGSEEAVGKTPKMLNSGIHTPHFYSDLWQQLNNKHRWSGEIWNRRKNGEIYPQWGSISAILDTSGKVQNYVAVFSDISKAKQAEKKLDHLATHDHLTGLPNRVHFVDTLEAMIGRSQRHEQQLAIVFIDLDHFKIINDTLGHAGGDAFLKIVANRLLGCARPHGKLARWGGDEFILAIANMPGRDHVAQAMQTMLHGLAEPVQLDGHELVPTACLGISVYPEDGADAASLIKAADTAMRQVKGRGRNGFAFFAAEMLQDLNSKLTLTTELRYAVQEKQFFLAYQPQVDPRNQRVKGVEALIRWHHPTRGILSPALFLDTLQEMGLMPDLGNWVLTEACRQMKSWSLRGVPIPRVAVNVAPVQLRESFVDTVAQAIQDAGIVPSQLELEITEGALESGEQARKIATALRKLGVLLSVDDFGTGYSSLAHIKLFPITCFKIDKSFIDGLPGDEDDVTIVRTILALGSSFRVEVVAEGAETAEQVEFLQANGVTNIQGYFFARPMPADDLEQWLTQRLENDTDKK